MTTVTETRVLEASIPLTSPIALFRELVEMGQEYGMWRDDLSNRMHHWMGRAVEAFSEGEAKEIQDISIAASAQIEQLATLLVNPMDGSPLIDPMLERSWTWERVDLENYRQMSPLSPYDGHVLEPQEHLFAKAMIDWKKRASSLFPLRQQALAAVQTGPKEMQLRVFAYMQMAQNGMQVQALRALQQRVVDVTIACEQRSLELKAETAAEIERAKERVELHHAAVEQKVTTMCTQHAQIVSAQACELQLHKETSEQRQAALSATQRSLEKEKERLAGMHDELAKAWQRIAWLEKELRDADDDTCTIL